MGRICAKCLIDESATPTGKLQSCSACKTVQYCSKSCQVSHARHAPNQPGTIMASCHAPNPLRTINPIVPCPNQQGAIMPAWRLVMKANAFPAPHSALARCLIVKAISPMLLRVPPPPCLGRPSTGPSTRSSVGPSVPSRPWRRRRRAVTQFHPSEPGGNGRGRRGG